MPDILHTMTIILPNSALPWSRVNDHKKSGGRWQLSLLASAVISAFFLNTAYAWQQEYIVDTQPDIPQSVTPGIAIINLITTIFCRNVFKVAKGRWDWKSIWRKKPLWM